MSELLDSCYKIKGKKYGRGPLYFGVELEVELSNAQDWNTRNELVHHITEEVMPGFCICKTDGSLSCGFEIVTRPASLAQHKKRWEPFYKARRRDSQLRSLKSFGTSTCGLHVHCSRHPLDNRTIGKCLVFINSDYTRHFVTFIGQRTYNRYSQFKKKTVNDISPHLAEHYDALNLSNRATIEFRIFKGNLHRTAVYRAIEFCHALICFARKPGTDCEGPNTVNEFVAFVGRPKNRKLYPHLSEYIQSRWFRKSPVKQQPEPSEPSSPRRRVIEYEPEPSIW